eukprot:5847849-Pyramimonas_sp.AAC.1
MALVLEIHTRTSSSSVMATSRKPPSEQSPEFQKGHLRERIVAWPLTDALCQMLMGRGTRDLLPSSAPHLFSVPLSVGTKVAPASQGGQRRLFAFSALGRGRRASHNGNGVLLLHSGC